MNLEKFRSAPMQLKPLIFFHLIIACILVMLVVTDSTLNTLIACFSIYAVLFLAVFMYWIFFGFCAQVTDTEVHFLRHGKIIRKISLSSNNFSARVSAKRAGFVDYNLLSSPIFRFKKTRTRHRFSKISEITVFTREKKYKKVSLKSRYFPSDSPLRKNGSPPLYTRKMRKIAHHAGVPIEFRCWGVSRKTFDKFMTSILHASFKSKAPGVDKHGISHSSPHSFSFPDDEYIYMKKHQWIYPRVVFSTSIMVIAVVLFILIFLQERDFPLNVQFGLIVSGPFFIAAIIPLAILLNLNRKIQSLVPAHIEFREDILIVDDRSFTLSDITCVKALPPNYISLTTKNIRKVSIFEGRNKTVFWLGDCSVNANQDMQFPEYKEFYGVLSEFLEKDNKFPNFVS